MKYHLKFIRTDVTSSEFTVEVHGDKSLNDIIDELIFDEDMIDDNAGVVLGEWDLEACKPVQSQS